MGDAFLIQNIKPSGPPIVITNLIIHLDASNPASYPGTGTTWTNLAQNNFHFTLENGASFDSTDKAIQTGPNGKRARVASLPSEFVGDPAMTVCMWIKRTANNSSGFGSWGIGSQTQYRGVSSWYSTATDFISYDVWSGGTFRAPVQYPLNEWAFVVWQKIPGSTVNTNIILWRNLDKYTGGQLTQLRSNTTVPNIGNSGTLIGVNIGEHGLGTTNTFAAKFGVAMFYNRVLTVEEITQNYNATKSKFGL